MISYKDLGKRNPTTRKKSVHMSLSIYFPETTYHHESNEFRTESDNIRKITKKSYNDP